MRIGYGIDADHGVVVRAARRRGGPAFRTLCAGGLTAGATAEARAALLRGRAEVAAALPTGEAVLRRLAAPLASPRKAARILPSVLESGLPFALEHCVTHIADLAAAGPAGVEAVGMAALRERVEARLAALAEAGVEAGRLEHEGRALWRQGLVEAPPAAGDERRMVVFASAGRLALALGRGHRLEAATAAERTPTGLAGARRWVQAAGNADAAAPLRALWAGPAAGAEAPDDLLAALVPTGRFAVERLAEPETFLARALAGLAVADGDPGFRSGALAHPAAIRRAQRGLARRAIAVLVFALALSAANLAWTARVARIESRAWNALNARARALTGSAVPPGFEVQRAREHAARQSEETAPLAAFFRPSLTASAADLLDAARRDGLEVAALTLSADAFTLEGRAPDWNRPERTVARLRAAGYQVRLERGEAGADPRVPFALHGELP